MGEAKNRGDREQRIEEAKSRQEIDARLELTAQPGIGVTCEIEVTHDEENPARILAAFIGRNLHELVSMAEREHKSRKQAVEEALGRKVITDVAPRLAGPDGSPLN